MNGSGLLPNRVAQTLDSESEKRPARCEPLTLAASLAYHTAMQNPALLLSLLLLRRQTGE